MVSQRPPWEPGSRQPPREHWAGSPPLPPWVAGAVGAGCKQFPGTVLIVLDRSPFISRIN